MCNRQSRYSRVLRDEVRHGVVVGIHKRRTAARRNRRLRIFERNREPADRIADHRLTIEHRTFRRPGDEVERIRQRDQILQRRPVLAEHPAVERDEAAAEGGVIGVGHRFVARTDTGLMADLAADEVEFDIGADLVPEHIAVALQEQARFLRAEVGISARVLDCGNRNRIRQIEITARALHHASIAESAGDDIKLDVAAPGDLEVIRLCVRTSLRRRHSGHRRRGWRDAHGRRRGRLGLQLFFERINAALQILDHRSGIVGGSRRRGETGHRQPYAATVPGADGAGRWPIEQADWR